MAYRISPNAFSTIKFQNEKCVFSSILNISAAGQFIAIKPVVPCSAPARRA